MYFVEQRTYIILSASNNPETDFIPVTARFLACL